MREHNAGLQTFVTVTDAPAATGAVAGTAVAAGLAAVQTAGTEMRTQPPAAVPVPDCTEELLAREKSAPINNDNWD